MMGALLILDGSVLGPGRVLDWNEIPQEEVVKVGRIVMPLSALCRNQLQLFICPPGGAVTIEAEAEEWNQLFLLYHSQTIYDVYESVIQKKSIFNDYQAAIS